MDIEVWKIIEGYEDYEVSNFGNVISFKRENVTSLKKCKLKNGLLYVNLYYNGVRKCCLIQRLVCDAFLGKSDLCIIHKDGNKENNTVSNLELVSWRDMTSKTEWNKEITSKFIGVSWHSNKKKWVSIINVNNKNVFLGYFKKEEDAAKAYLDYKEKLK